MSFSVEFTAGARQDLLKISGYIKESGRPEAARRLQQQLTEACASLSQHPERGHIPEELEELSALLCRAIIVKKHRILYQVIGKVVVIHGVIDGRRNIRETMRQRILF